MKASITRVLLSTILLASFNSYAQKNNDLIGTWVLYKEGDSTKHISKERIIFTESTFDFRSISYQETETVKRVNGKIISSTKTKKLIQKLQEKGSYERTSDKIIFKNRNISVTPKMTFNGPPVDWVHKYKMRNGELIFITPLSIKEGDTFKASGDSINRYFRRKGKS